MKYVAGNTNDKLFLDLNGVDFKNVSFIKNAISENILTFSIGSYGKLKKKINDTVNWSIVFDPVNRFFARLENDDKAEIAAAIIEMHAIMTVKFSVLNETNKFIILQVAHELSQKYKELDDKIDLVSKLRQFVVEELPMADCRGVGSRPQDTPELTFNEDDVINVMTIVMLCKLIAPIFGLFMFYIKDIVDVQAKERHCAIILNDILASRYKQLFLKLQNYIAHTVDKKMSKTGDNVSAIYCGKTNNTMSQFIMDNVLVRNFVNVDMNYKGGNIMTYISVSVKKTVTTQEKNVNKKHYVEKEEYYSSSDEEGNESQFEKDTLIATNKTFSIYPLLSFSIPHVIKEQLNFYQLNYNEYFEALKFYTQDSIVKVNDFNIFMMCMYFSRLLGGSKSVYMLQYNEYIQLLVLLQLLTMKMGYLMTGHLLTATNEIDESYVTGTISPSGHVAYTTSEYYRRAMTLFTNKLYKQSQKTFESQISNMHEFLMQHKWFFNTATSLWGDIEKALGKNFVYKNGKRMVIGPDRIIEMCSFIVDIYGPDLQ